MKLSAITPAVAAQYLRLDYSSMSSQDKTELDAFIIAAKAYVKAQTGLKDTATTVPTDDYPDLAIAGLVLVQDMYDNRSMVSDKPGANKTVETILGMHRVNLV